MLYTFLFYYSFRFYQAAPDSKPGDIKLHFDVVQLGGVSGCADSVPRKHFISAFNWWDSVIFVSFYGIFRLFHREAYEIHAVIVEHSW